MNLELRAFAGGSCRHLLAMVDRRTWRVVDFPALFLALRHPREGWILVDTGYGDRFLAATQSFPQRFYRWVTPATPAGTTSALLAAAGIPPAEIRHVVVTHFHADHVGGLAEFPHATIHHHAEALEPLSRLPAWRQVRAAFLASLVPAWLPARARPLAAAAFGPAADLPFPAHDLFGDGAPPACGVARACAGAAGAGVSHRGRAAALRGRCVLAGGAGERRGRALRAGNVDPVGSGGVSPYGRGVAAHAPRGTLADHRLP